jgi:phosphatidylethanolamine-binding protein (PEBP) family uncharacterized protein
MTTTDAGLAEIRLTSPAFEYGKPIPKVHTCDGDDASPVLRWTGGPMARSYALDISLNLAPGATKGELEQAMEQHTVAQGTLMGTYQRQKA